MLDFIYRMRTLGILVGRIYFMKKWHFTQNFFLQSAYTIGKRKKSISANLLLDEFERNGPQKPRTVFLTLHAFSLLSDVL